MPWAPSAGQPARRPSAAHFGTPRLAPAAGLSLSYTVICLKKNYGWKRGVGCSVADPDPQPWLVGIMDQISIKTPNPKYHLYWCLLEFIDWRYSQSCLYFRPLFWTRAPLTFLLVHPPPPHVNTVSTGVHAGAYPEGMHRMHVHPPPPPQPERLVNGCEKRWGSGQQEKNASLPKHNYKWDNNLLTVESRAVDPHCFDADPEADPDPAQNLDADPDPDPGGGGGRSAKNVHPAWQNPRYAPGCMYSYSV